MRRESVIHKCDMSALCPAFLECWIIDEEFRTCGVFVFIQMFAPNQAKRKRSHKKVACVCFCLTPIKLSNYPRLAQFIWLTFVVSVREFMNTCVDSERQLDAAAHQEVNIGHFITCTHLRTHLGPADGGLQSCDWVCEACKEGGSVTVRLNARVAEWLQAPCEWLRNSCFRRILSAQHNKSSQFLLSELELKQLLFRWSTKN